MSYYHVRIRYKDPENNYDTTDYELDLLDEEAKILGEQYEEGRVLFKGKWIDVANIKEIEILEALSKSTSYYPSLTPATIFYGTRTNITSVTRQFIKSYPKKEEISKKHEKPKQPLSKNIFIVHGLDDKPKLELARMLEKLGFNVIILSEQPNKGRTIIEKLEQETIDIGYVFVILTPEDVIADLPIPPPPPPYPPFQFKHRARQNVILELGYFVGKIGRNRVCCLYKGDIELPSDIHGVLFKKFEKSVEECFKSILEELKAAGYEIKI